MSRNKDIFQRAVNHWFERGFALQAGIVFILLFVVGIWISIEDYMTTVYGWYMLPTKVWSDWTPYAIAFIPILGQMASVYLFAAFSLDNDKENDRYALISLITFFVFLIIDSFPDFLFRFDGQEGIVAFLTNFMLTITVFTIGSEVTLTISSAVVVAYIRRLINGRITNDTIAPIQREGRRVFEGVRNSPGVPNEHFGGHSSTRSN